ncbi:MAG TPA: hypothetical protein VMV45_06275, partial [Casimicrobiaceae bacterium]|nr:hypothetical protein [Casimicrobiaceae bacterium]
MEWDADAALGLGYDSNLGRAASEEDRRGDAAVLASGSLGASTQISDDDRLRAWLGAEGEARFRYTGLSEVAISVNSQWRHKFGLGLGAPSATVVGTAQYIDSHDPLRDGWRFVVEASLARRFSEQVELIGGASYERRLAGDFPLVPGISGAAFDLVGFNAFVQGSYALDEAWLLGAQYNVRRGDVVSVSQRGPAIFFASSAIA